jgi:ABC-2 type transport system ATP-binding protein
VGIAQSIVHRPRLLILDEPMSGLDPVGRKSMRDLILSLKREGTTVIFSSHILPDAEALCDRVGILVHGAIKEVVDLRQLGGRNPAFALAVRGVDAAVLERFGAARSGALHSGNGASETSRLVLTFPDVERAWMAMQCVREHGGEVESLNPVLPSLEDRFLRYMQGMHAD